MSINIWNPKVRFLFHSNHKEKIMAHFETRYWLKFLWRVLNGDPMEQGKCRKTRYWMISSRWKCNGCRRNRNLGANMKELPESCMRHLCKCILIVYYHSRAAILLPLSWSWTSYQWGPNPAVCLQKTVVERYLLCLWQSSIVWVEWVFHLKPRSEEHTSELQSPVPISYAVFCLKKKKTNWY